jgi:hypothetical protein
MSAPTAIAALVIACVLHFCEQSCDPAEVNKAMG